MTKILIIADFAFEVIYFSPRSFVFFILLANRWHAENCICGSCGACKIDCDFILCDREIKWKKRKEKATARKHWVYWNSVIAK